MGLPQEAPGSIIDDMKTDNARAEGESVGEGECLIVLNARYRGPLLAYFRRRVGSVSEAQDLTQDVFERLILPGIPP